MSGPLLQVSDLCVEYAAATGLFARTPLRALDGVSFEVGAGETVGLVGESGSGKSTLARAIMRLVPAARGQIWWRGLDLRACGARELRKTRRDLQMVFQDPLASLDPRMTVGEILAEPLRVFEPAMAATARATEIGRMLERVGLETRMAAGHPHEFSGGQCQRIGIARAMMLRPTLLICDEAAGSLDVSIQGQIVNLLRDLQRETGMAMLFISHNLAVVRHISHRVLVIHLGRLIEIAPRDELFAAPMHPYTRALIAAVAEVPSARLRSVPPAQVTSRGQSTPLVEPPSPVSTRGPSTPLVEPPSPWEIPSGCGFRSGCPVAEPVCAARAPRLERVSARHWVSCHRCAPG